ncbi:hypothetical protein RSAG8_05804, partial [Rhizoctonia solani AG-8 WAC10335]
MTVNRVIFHLAIKFAWYEVRGIDKVLKLLQYTTLPYSNNMYDSGKAIVLGEPSMEYHLVENIPEAALGRVSMYGSNIVILHAHDSALNAIFHGLSVLLTMGPVTPHLRKLILYPRDLPPAPFCTEVSFLLDLCGPDTLTAFYFARRRNRPMERGRNHLPLISTSELTGVLCKLQSKQIRDLSLGLDYYFVSTTVQGGQQQLDSCLGELTTIYLFSSALPVVPLNLLARLPHLSSLTLTFSQNMIEPLPSALDGHTFPSLACIKLSHAEYKAATRLLSILPAQLQVVYLSFRQSDDDDVKTRSYNITLNDICISTLSGLQQLTKFAAVLRFPNQHTMLRLFRNWPGIKHLHLPDCPIDPEGLVELAMIWPHLTSMSVKLSMLHTPLAPAFGQQNKTSYTNNEGFKLESAYSLSSPSISTASPRLSLQTDLDFDLDKCREVACLLVGCWKNVALSEHPAPKLQATILKRIKNEIEIFRGVAG